MKLPAGAAKEDIPVAKGLLASAPRYVRRTITIPRTMEKAILDLVGPRKFSAFAREALSEKLQRERIGGFRNERDAGRS